MAVPSLNNKEGKDNRRPEDRDQNTAKTAATEKGESDSRDSKTDSTTESKSDGAHPADAPPREPQTPFGRLHRFLLGDPIPTRDADESRLPKVLALPVFSSDAISSVAYATQEILLALGAAGLAVAANKAAYTHYTWAVAAAIGVLLVIIAASYRQTIFAYPSGGGSYLVSKDNLGVHAGLIAAAALLIDYVLTVAVSIASGVQNLASIPLLERFHVEQHAVPICLTFVALLTLANLRGLKQAGALFAIPTYLFIGLSYTMVVLGLVGSRIGWHLHLEAANQALPEGYGTKGAIGGVSLFVVLRAFANGCSAMTGTEAISNGIPAFQKPESKNAATTLMWMAFILGSLFIGISWLATQLHVVYWEHHGETSPAVIDQLSGTIFGRTGSSAWLYYAMQFATAGILILAANTSFADFPRLASILANDRFLPRNLANRGDRLVFSGGILLLGLFAALLLVLFKGSVDRLIPLYALGVFTAFTLSQSGMVRHWFTHQDKGWQIKAVVNGIGATATAIVFGVIIYEKFREGAWMVVGVAACLVALFLGIHHQYEAIWEHLRLDGPGDLVDHSASPIDPSHTQPIPTSSTSPALATTPTPETGTGSNTDTPPSVRNEVLVLVPGVHRAILPALRYARLIAQDFRALYVEIDPDRTKTVQEEWQLFCANVPLQILPSPYRSLVGPVLDYIDQIEKNPEDVVTVIITETFTDHWWDILLHNTAGPLLKLQLLGRADVIVTNVRYRIKDASETKGSP